MTLNPPSSRSLRLHVKYFENGDRYDDGVNESRIGNHPWAPWHPRCHGANWHHDLWPWMIVNRRSSRSLQLQSNISITVYGMQQHWADTRSIERISCLFLISAVRISMKIPVSSRRGALWQIRQHRSPVPVRRATVLWATSQCSAVTTATLSTATTPAAKASLKLVNVTWWCVYNVLYNVTIYCHYYLPNALPALDRL